MEVTVTKENNSLPLVYAKALQNNLIREAQKWHARRALREKFLQETEFNLHLGTQGCATSVEHLAPEWEIESSTK